MIGKRDYLLVVKSQAHAIQDFVVRLFHSNHLMSLLASSKVRNFISHRPSCDLPKLH